MQILKWLLLAVTVPASSFGMCRKDPDTGFKGEIEVVSIQSGYCFEWSGKKYVKKKVDSSCTLTVKSVSQGGFQEQGEKTIFSMDKEICLLSASQKAQVEFSFKCNDKIGRNQCKSPSGIWAHPIKSPASR